MQRYANPGGNSGVKAYELREDGIEVEFDNGSRYLYTQASAGAARIARMQRLAEAGRGLSTYISQIVRDGFEERLS